MGGLTQVYSLTALYCSSPFTITTLAGSINLFRRAVRLYSELRLSTSGVLRPALARSAVHAGVSNRGASAPTKGYHHPVHLSRLHTLGLPLRHRPRDKLLPRSRLHPISRTLQNRLLHPCWTRIRAATIVAYADLELNHFITKELLHATFTTLRVYRKQEHGQIGSYVYVEYVNDNYLLICWEGLGHLVLTASRFLRLAVIKLEKVAELIILPLVNQVLTVNLTELIVMAKDLNLFRHQAFISIVMSLNDETLNLPKIFTTLAWRRWSHLWEDKIVVTVCKNAWNCHAFLNSNLVIVSVYGQTLHSILLSDFKSRIMII